MPKLIRKMTGFIGVFALGFLMLFAPYAHAQTASPVGDPVTYNIYPYSGGGFLGSGNSSLGNLAVLDKLFNNGTTGVLSGNGNLNLGDLVLLDQAFGNSNIGNQRFPDLFALGRIFGGGGNSILNDNGTSFGDILILDQLFR